VATTERECKAFEAWTWLAVVAGAGLVALGATYLLRRRNPIRSVDRLLRRCERRIQDLESAVIGLESALSADGG
jgi:hypothetical protein